jgi:hypothetical protein
MTIAILVTLAWANPVSGIILSNRVWAVKGPSGYYGLVESHSTAIGRGAPVRVETTICFEPFYYTFYASMPVVLCVTTVALGILAIGVVWFLGRGKITFSLGGDRGPTIRLTER